MKELSIEEKAKRYEEALDNAKVVYKTIRKDLKPVIEQIFPELKVSDDERIREEMLQIAKESEDSFYMALTPNKRETLIAWLEKQGEQKSIDKPNKVETVFHEGDWVISKFTGSVYQIKYCLEVSNHKYGYDLTDGGYIGSDEVNQYRLWTIKDAKDGDVLACKNGWTCIFKTLVNDKTFGSYCFIDCTGWFCEDGGQAHTLDNSINIHPATKEQRDLLFQKVKEAGYEWSDKDRKPIKIAK